MLVKLLLPILLLLILTGCSKIEKALSCPEGQHSELAYYMPIIHEMPGGSTWVQEVPIYECVND